jgi:sugar phosphate isomerase/epimerase
VGFFHGRLAQTTVIHLHGIGERDHQSLALMPVQAIDHLIRALLEYPFRGVLTLEVFSEDDLNSSLQAIMESHKRIKGQ